MLRGHCLMGPSKGALRPCSETPRAEVWAPQSPHLLLPQPWALSDTQHILNSALPSMHTQSAGTCGSFLSRWWCRRFLCSTRAGLAANRGTRKQHLVRGSQHCVLHQSEGHPRYSTGKLPALLQSSDCWMSPMG